MSSLRQLPHALLWAGALLAVVGRLLALHSGFALSFFLFAAALSAVGLFIPRPVCRIAATLMIAVCVSLAYNGYRSALYTDAEVEALKQSPLVETEDGRIAYLNVVPPGEAYPRKDVFESLGIEERRLKRFRSFGMMAVENLTWQISPAYDIQFMTATNDPQNRSLAFTNPKRLVYGVKILKRSQN